MAEVSTGARIRDYRHRRGLTQANLAARIDRSERWLRDVENGNTEVDRYWWIVRIAEALAVDPRELVPGPLHLAPNGALDFSGLPGLRRCVIPYGVLEDRPIDLPSLRRDVDAAWLARQSCQYRDLSADLPSIVAKARAAVEQHEGEERTAALGLFSQALFLVSRVAEIVGDQETGYSAAQAGYDAAHQSGAVLAQGHAAYRYALPLLRSGRHAEAKDVCLAAAIRVEPTAGGQDKAAVSVYGALMLMGAISAARQSDRAGAQECLAEAGEASGRLGDQPQNHWWTVFGAPNVALHGVSVAVELGETGLAVERAKAVDVSLFPPEMVERRSRLSLELARCYAAERKDEAAIHALLQAEALVPEEIRHQQIVRDIVRAILRRSRSSPGAARLGQRLGIAAS